MCMRSRARNLAGIEKRQLPTGYLLAEERTQWGPGVASVLRYGSRWVSLPA